ncbi:MAG: hypothetical protein HKN26_17275 [Acidimicrobiales bacterium]|nr:hypothetical protein [Acidimicrobiales bacterium]
MSTFQIALTNDRTEIVDGVDGYEQEGAMTTFFIRGSSRQVIDSWSVRVASYRTAEIQTIRRMTADATAAPAIVSAVDAPGLDDPGLADPVFDAPVLAS